jgi:hypothetical protein
MQRLRVGPLDLAAAIVVLVVLFLPPRAMTVESAYARVAPEDRASLADRLARAQAAISRDPADGAAAQEMVELLLAQGVGQHDQALRVAGEAARHEGSPTRWRALLAMSWAHAERFEIQAAHDVAAQALTACQATPSACPVHERARIQFFLDELAAGVEAIARGFDPRSDPAGFRRELSRAHPTTTFRTIRGR